MKVDTSLTHLLEWHIACGAEEVISFEPVNRFETPCFSEKTEQRFLSQSTPQPQTLAPTPVKEDIPLPPVLTEVETLADLRQALEAFDGSSLKQTATNLVFGAGNPEADLMIIGEAPGADEDRQGEPFVGKSGQLLTQMLHSIGKEKDSVYITNVLPWRPPANRKPSEEEIALFLPFLHKHISLVQPKVLLLLGGSALHALLGVSTGITKARGTWQTYSYQETTLPALPSFHPAFLLRSSAQKKYAWQDFLQIKKKLESL